MTTLNTLLKDSAYKLTQFSPVQIEALEKRIIDKEIRGKVTPHVVCLVRNKEIKLTPEEVVRQLYLMVLIDDLGYPVSRIALEYGVTFGRETKRADICIFDKDRPTVPYILVELKKPKLKDGKEQLKSYCNATGAPIGVWSNGDSISWYQRKDPNYFEPIPRIPSALEKLSDVLSERWTIEDLIKINELVNEKKSLKELILEMEDEVLANAGVDVFEELFKLIFTKLYDEMEGWRDKKKHLVFKNYGDTETELKTKIQNLFDKARGKWEGVFSDDAKLQLTPSHLSLCVSSLEKVMLFNSNLDVVDEAFEYLINKSSKGEKGQYFTPRYVIDMCVKMLNPQEHETLIDTAAGSCGFPVHGIFHVWEQILKEEGLHKSHLFTAEAKPPRCTDYVVNKVFAIDFDEKAVRVGRTLNLIAGDGQTNVLHLNTLDFERWDEKTKDEEWSDIYGDGWKKLRKLRTTKDENRDFEFDVLMANPPFAGDIKETRILSKYELGKKDNSKYQTNVGRDILFIERNLSFLKAGGRMAVVLPQGRFNNSSDKQIREFIAARCRILAVVGLHGNVFKPHTGIKTSVLFVQKWTHDDGICPRKDDYPIFFATMQEPSKDNSGDKIYQMQADGFPLLDSHGHLIVKHDLFNHEGLTQDGIAEAFVEFAKKEKLSFFDSSPFDEVKYRALLEGLEISEVNLSELEYSGRLDSEYYRPVFLEYEKTVTNKKSLPLSALSNFLIGPFGSDFTVENYTDDKSYRYIRGKDVKQMKLMDDDNVYLPKVDFERLSKYALKENDILVSVVGTLGNAALIQKESIPAIFSCKSTVLRVKEINAAYLLTYINSKYGRSLLLRKERGAIQKGLNLDDLKTLDIYVSTEKLQLLIEQIFKSSIEKEKESKKFYSKAENHLLDALGMADFSPSNENINIKSFKDSFLTTGRLDAEYYQPKYEEMMAHISAQNHDKLSALVTIQKSIETGSDAYSGDENGLPYLRVADYNKFGITEPQKKLTDSFVADNFEKLENLKPKAGTILFSKDGSVGEAFCLQEDANFITSGAVLHLTVRDKEKVLPDYLTLTLNSKLVKMQAERDAGGSIILHWRVGEIENVIVPIIEMETQTKITALVQQSFALKAESETLLELAKRAVEMAIEEDETAAMEFISRKMELFNGS